MSGFYARVGRFAPRLGRGPKRWVLVLYDQLRPDHLCSRGRPPRPDSSTSRRAAKPARRPYHKQKLTLLLSAQRHDALARAAAGHPVLYRFSEKWYDGALAEVRAAFGLETGGGPRPRGSRGPRAALQARLAPLQPNSLFITDRAFYRSVFPKPGRRLLETFYRAARRQTGLLMDGTEPVGGQWNLDRENRETWKGRPRVRPALPSSPTR